MSDRKMTVFISAVTAEFGRLRDRVASRLRAKGHLVKVQSDFRQEDFSDTTLSKLHGYIQGCDRVIALVGNQSGSFPPPAAVAPYDHLRPPELSQLSLTQWEVIFARATNPKGLFLYDGRTCPAEGPAASGDADQQAAWVAYLNDTLQLDRNAFATPDEALNLVLELDWPNLSLGKPNNLPFGSRNHLFIGREKVLQDLRASLLSGAPTAVTAQALHAMGGVGKTQLAVEYALRHQGDYSAILFLSARVEGAQDARHSLRNSLALLAEPTALNLPNRQQVDLAAQSVLGWLRQNGDWLLIVDNVDTAASAKAVEALLGQLGKGHVLITARFGNWSDAVRKMPLENLSPEHAAQLLLDTTAGNRLTQSDDAAVAAGIAGDLGHLALALQQAAAYVKRKRISLADYRKRLAENRAKVLDWFDPQSMNYPAPVATTWAVTVTELSEVSRELLNIISLYAPDPIPRSLLDPLGDTGEEALAELADYALIAFDTDTPTFTVHPLLQEVTRQRLGEELDQYLDVALNALLTATSGKDPQDVRTWPTYRPLEPHATALLGHLHASDARRGLSSLLNLFGLLATKRAHWLHAEALCRRALAINEARHGSDDPRVATSLNNLAAVLDATNRLLEAEALYRRALAINEASYGLDHPEVANRLNNLANVLQSTNRLTEAEAMYRRALAIDEASYGPDHPLVANRLNNLASLLQATNRLTEAEEIYVRSLAIYEANYGPDHPDVANSLTGLGSLLAATNRLPKAEAMFRRALAIDEASYGPDHPYVATSLNGIARLLYTTKRLQEAEALYRRALTINEASYGPDHPNVATNLCNLARILLTTNFMREAEAMLRRALEILLLFKLTTKHDHPDLQGVMSNWGDVFLLLGNGNAEVQAAFDSIMVEVTAKAANG